MNKISSFLLLGLVVLVSQSTPRKKKTRNHDAQKSNPKKTDPQKLDRVRPSGNNVPLPTGDTQKDKDGCWMHFGQQGDKDVWDAKCSMEMDIANTVQNEVVRKISKSIDEILE
jgi:hypothetical protein